jgi:hypothetical protein
MVVEVLENCIVLVFWPDGTGIIRPMLFFGKTLAMDNRANRSLVDAFASCATRFWMNPEWKILTLSRRGISKRKS